MAERSAYDIMNMLGSSQRESTQLVGSLIDSGFRNATTGIKTAADIMSQTVQAGIDYKKTVVDEWYKAENLKQNDRSIDATISYHAASLAQRDRELEANETRWKAQALNEAEKTRIAKENKDASAFLSIKTKEIDDERMRLIGKLQIDKASEASIVKQLEADSNDLNMTPLKPSQKKALQTELERIRSSISETSSKNDILGIKAERAYRVIGQLQGGVIDKETATNLLTEPGQEYVPSGSEPSKPLPKLAPGAIPQYNPAIEAPKVTMDKDDEDHYDTNSALEYTSKAVAKNGPDKAAPYIQKFLNEYADDNAKQHFADKRTELEKQYFEDLFAPITVGTDDAAKQFRLDQEEFKRKYTMYGGTSERLNQLKEAGKLKFNEFSKKDPSEVTAEVQKYAALVFPEQNKNVNDFSNTQKPARVLGQNGQLEIKLSPSGDPESVTIVPGAKPLTIDDKKKEENDAFLKQASDIMFGIRAKDDPKNIPLLKGRSGQVEQTGREKTIFKRDSNGEFGLSTYGLQILATMDFTDFVDGGLAKLSDNPITQTNGEYLSKDTIRRSEEFELKEKERISNFLLKKENRSKAIAFFAGYLKKNPKMIN